MNITRYLKRLSESPIEERKDIVESINLQNYGLGILSETEMWILRSAAEDEAYLQRKLKEADELTLDKEAPSEEEDDLSLDPPEDDDLTLDDEPDSPEGDDDLSLDDTTGGDEPEADDLSLDDDPEGNDEPDDKKIETSLEGAGILPLLAQIQDKLANGKPSEMELAALKALKKIF